MKKARLFRKLLFPFSYVYGSIMAARNLLFKFQILKSHSFNIPVISVGNISVGGTGKTPHIEFLIEMFCKDKKVAVLSRGYKRKTKGFRIVNEQDTGLEAGDEPVQIKQKFLSILVAVDEKRVHGIEQLLQLEDPPEIVLLDDAFQHRWVKPGLQILLDNFNDQIHDDMVLPAGNLREFPGGKKRADVVIVSKCDGITEFETKMVREQYKQTHPKALFFSQFRYSNPKPVFDGCLDNIEESKLNLANVLVVTGIANSEPFEEFVRSKCTSLETLRFSDHHEFTESDISKIIDRFASITSEKKYLITTEKDAVRLREHKQLEEVLTNSCFYIPIKVNILFKQEEELKKILLNYVQ